MDRKRLLRIVAVIIAMILILFALRWAFTGGQPTSLQGWVESQKHVLLVPPDDQLMPGDIISLPAAVAGQASSGQMEILYRASSLLGADVAGAVRRSSTSNVSFTDSIGVFARSGALGSRSIAEAVAQGHRVVEVILTDITVERIEHSWLEDALARRPRVMRQIRGRMQRSPGIYVVNSVIRAKYNYRFSGDGGVGTGAGLPAEGSSAGPAANGQFESRHQTGSDQAMVIGYSIAAIHLPDEAADGPAAAASVTLNDLDVEEARPLQPHATAKLWPLRTTIKVGFLDGDESQTLRFRQAMQMWLEHANLSVEYVAPEAADIRVSFADPTIAWSFIGTDARTQPFENGPTMMAGGATAQPGFGRLLHEIGHALGLVHEFYNPTAGDILRQPWVSDYARNLKMTEDELRQRFGGEARQYPGFRQFDPHSVMHPPLPDSLRWQGSPVRAGNMLTDSDRRYIRTLYPYYANGRRL